MFKKSLLLMVAVMGVMVLSSCSWTPGPKVLERSKAYENEYKQLKAMPPGKEYYWLDDNEIAQVQQDYLKYEESAGAKCRAILGETHSIYDSGTAAIPGFIKNKTIKKAQGLVLGTKEKPTALGLLLGTNQDVIDFMTLYATMKIIQQTGVLKADLSALDAAAILIGGELSLGLPSKIIYRDAVALRDYGKELKVFYDEGRQYMIDYVTYTDKHREYRGFVNDVNAHMQQDKVEYEKAYNDVKNYILKQDKERKQDEKMWPKIEEAIAAAAKIDPEKKMETYEPNKKTLLGMESGLMPVCNSATSSIILNVQKSLNMILGLASDNKENVAKIDSYLKREKALKDNLKEQYATSQRFYNYLDMQFQSVKNMAEHKK